MDRDYETTAAVHGLEVSAIMAVAEVEAGPLGAFASDGRPIVRYEQHIFQRRTGAAYHHTHPHLSQPNEEKGKPYHTRSQLNEWSLIYGAMILRAGAGGDRRASDAWQSSSWGRFQVMGFNHAAGGWASVNNFVYDMFVSEAKHLQAYIGYCNRANLIRHLKSHNWHDFAIGYNGGIKDKTTGQMLVAHDYDTKMGTAYTRISAQRKARGVKP